MVRGHQNDRRPPHMFLRTVPIRHDLVAKHARLAELTSISDPYRIQPVSHVSISTGDRLLDLIHSSGQSTQKPQRRQKTGEEEPRGSKEFRGPFMSEFLVRRPTSSAETLSQWLTFFARREQSSNALCIIAPAPIV